MGPDIPTRTASAIAAPIRNDRCESDFGLENVVEKRRAVCFSEATPSNLLLFVITSLLSCDVATPPAAMARDMADLSPSAERRVNGKTDKDLKQQQELAISIEFHKPVTVRVGHFLLTLGDWNQRQDLGLPKLTFQVIRRTVATLGRRKEGNTPGHPKRVAALAARRPLPTFTGRRFPRA
jgi:hypothetical protein